MKILETRTAPNPRRVRIFLAEKGIAVPYEEVDIMKGAHKEPKFTSANPMQRVPALTTALSSLSRSPFRYFEETKPEPALFGKGALGKALVEMAAPHGDEPFGSRGRSLPASASGCRGARGAADQGDG